MSRGSGAGNPYKRGVTGSNPVAPTRSEQQKTVPHLRKRGHGTVLCSPAGYGCSRPTATSCAQYAPNSVGVIVAAPSHAACDNFLYGFKGARLRRCARPRQLARVSCSRQRMPVWVATCADERETIARRGSPGLCPQWAAALPAAFARERTARAAAARAAAARALPGTCPSPRTRRNATTGDQAVHERPGGRLRRASPLPEKSGALPPDPRPSLGDEQPPVIPSPGQAKALRPNPRDRQGRAALVPAGRPLPPPENRAKLAGCPTEGMTSPPVSLCL
jgi:hypothetical protein